MNQTQKKTFIGAIVIILLIISAFSFFSGHNSSDKEIVAKPSVSDSALSEVKEKTKTASVEDIKLLADALRSKNVALCEQIIDVDTKYDCLSNFVAEDELSKIRDKRKDTIDKQVILNPAKDEVKELSQEETNPKWVGIYSIIIAIFILVFYQVHIYRHKGQKSHHPKLVKHIKDSIKHGHKKKDIKDGLIHLGWKREIIEEAFEEVENE